MCVIKNKEKISILRIHLFIFSSYIFSTGIKKLFQHLKANYWYKCF